MAAVVVAAAAAAKLCSTPQRIITPPAQMALGCFAYPISIELTLYVAENRDAIRCFCLFAILNKFFCQPIYLSCARLTFCLTQHQPSAVTHHRFTYFILFCSGLGSSLNFKLKVAKSGCFFPRFVVVFNASHTQLKIFCTFFYCCCIAIRYNNIQLREINTRIVKK